jgi:hypothetical protein
LSSNSCAIAAVRAFDQVGDGPAALVEGPGEGLALGRQRGLHPVPALVEGADEGAQVRADGLVQRAAPGFQERRQLARAGPERRVESLAAPVQGLRRALETPQDALLERPGLPVQRRGDLRRAGSSTRLTSSALADKVSASAPVRAATTRLISSARASSARATSRPPSAMTRAISPVRTTRAR